MTIKLNGSTAGSVALDAPASTTGNADISFKLPVADGSANQVIQTNGSGQLSFATPYADPYSFSSWYITTTHAPSGQNVVITYWAESNADGYERLGTAPTYNNGIFTMPSTGYWRVHANIIYYHSTPTGDSGAFQLRHSTDSGSNFNAFATTGFRLDGSSASNQKNHWGVTGTFKVANTTTSRFQVYGVGLDSTNAKIMGGTMAGADEGYTCGLHIEKMRDL